MRVATKDKTAVCCNKICIIRWSEIIRQITVFLARWQLYNLKWLSLFSSNLHLGGRSVSSDPPRWCNDSIFGKKNFVLVETDCAPEKDIFCLYLLRLIQAREQQQWLMDQNIDFSWTGFHHCYHARRVGSLSTVKPLLSRPRGLPSNRYYEIMRDLRQRINNWSLIVFSSVLSSSDCQTLPYEHIAVMMLLLSVWSSHCKSDHRAAAGQQHMGWLHFHLMHFKPTSPINHAVSSSGSDISIYSTTTAQRSKV